MRHFFIYIVLFCITIFASSCDTTDPVIDGDNLNDSINTRVNFDSKLIVNGKVAPFFFGGTISTYGSTAIAQPAGSLQTSRLKALGLDGYRIPLKWNDGNVISSAVGGPTNISGDAWIAKLKEIGGEVVIVIGGKTKDNDISPEDAANMVKYFNERGVFVKNWIVGNEPSMNGLSIQQYCDMYNRVYDAMKAVDPSIKIGGPAWAYYDINALRSFIRLSGTKADIIDYHHYGMGEFFLSEEEALLQTQNYANEINEIRDMIRTELPGAENRIEIQLGEYHWSHRRNNGYQGWNGDDRFYKAVTTVWTASVAGLVAKAGGRSFQYSDLNGPLGLTFESSTEAAHFGRSVNDATPIYYGLFMFTGGNLFRHFGNEFAVASTSSKNVEIYASTSKNIVLVNKNPNLAKTIHFDIEGLSNEAKTDIWQTSRLNPFNLPINKGTHVIKDGLFTYTIPPYSVTTLVIN